MDEYTADAWHDLLGDLPLDECRAAVITIARRQRFAAASEIRTEVRRARAIAVAHSEAEAILAPARAHRDPLTDPRPLREEIEAILAQYHVRELLPSGQH